MNRQINILTHELKTIFDERLISIILHGAGAIEELNEEKSFNLFSWYFSKKSCFNIDLIVILDKLNASDLKKAYPFISKWKNMGHHLPVFMDKEEWFNSTDIYPIEYSDIKRRHKILYGENVVDSLNIDKCHLRLQCEYELKNLLIKLRETYLGNIYHTKFLNKIIDHSSIKLISLLRAILELSETSIPHSKIEMINLLSEKISIDKELFILLFEEKRENKSFSKNEIENVISRLIDTLNLLLKYVDNLDVCK